MDPGAHPMSPSNQRPFPGMSADGGPLMTNPEAPRCSKARAILNGALRPADPILAPEAARLLGELGDAEAIRPLLDYVKTDGDCSKTAGFYALQLIGDPGCALELAPFVDSPGVYEDYYWHQAGVVRAAAALAVHVLAPRMETPFFDRNLSEAPSVTLNMFCMLYSPVLLGLPPVSAVLAGLKHRTLEIIFSRKFIRPAHMARAAGALGQTGTEAAARELQWMLTLPSRYVRGAAAENLAACVSNGEAGRLLCDFFDRETTDFARVKAAGALVRLGDSHASSYLRGTLRGAADPFVKATAIDTVSQCLGTLDWDELRPHLYDPSPWVRSATLASLESLRAIECPEAAARLMDDPDPHVRIQAAKSFLAMSRETAR